MMGSDGEEDPRHDILATSKKASVDVWKKIKWAMGDCARRRRLVRGVSRVADHHS